MTEIKTSGAMGWIRRHGSDLAAYGGLLVCIIIFSIFPPLFGENLWSAAKLSTLMSNVIVTALLSVGAVFISSVVFMMILNGLRSIIYNNLGSRNVTLSGVDYRMFRDPILMEQFPIHELLQDFDVRLPYKIYNRGVGGCTTEELLEVLDICVYDLRPAHVFINIGTNDLNGPDYRQEDLIERYAQILQGIRGHLPEAKLFLLAYYPVNTVVGSRIPYINALMQYRTNARIKAANEAVRTLAERFEARFLDLNESLYDERGELKAEYTVEGMHMYADGYRPVLEQLLPLLKELA